MVMIRLGRLHNSWRRSIGYCTPCQFPAKFSSSRASLIILRRNEETRITAEYDANRPKEDIKEEAKDANAADSANDAAAVGVRPLLSSKKTHAVIRNI